VGRVKKSTHHPKLDTTMGAQELSALSHKTIYIIACPIDSEEIKKPEEVNLFRLYYPFLFYPYLRFVVHKPLTLP
jgi:hypothetical protein